MPKAFDIVINEEYMNNKKIFVVHCLNLGITSQGKTVEEAISNLKEATELYLEEFPVVKEQKPLIIVFEVNDHARVTKGLRA